MPRLVKVRIPMYKFIVMFLALIQPWTGRLRMKSIGSIKQPDLTRLPWSGTRKHHRDALNRRRYAGTPPLPSAPSAELQSRVLSSNSLRRSSGLKPLSYLIFSLCCHGPCSDGCLRGVVVSAIPTSLQRVPLAVRGVLGPRLLQVGSLDGRLGKPDGAVD